VKPKLHFSLINYRTTRSKLRERNSAASPTFPGSSNVAGSSPTAGPSGLTDEIVNVSGYNSGDEYGPGESAPTSETEWLEVHNFSLCHVKSFSINTLQTGDANLRFCVTTVKDR
jgi:hypothetical protein